MKPMRSAAAVLSAFLLLLPVAAVPASAQMQREQPTHGRPPSAAPSPGAAESQGLPPPNAAPTGTVDTTLVGDSTAQTESTFSPIGLFMRADLVVKAVLILLLAASLWSWVIIIDKWLAVGFAEAQGRQVREDFLVRPVARRALSAIFQPRRSSHGGGVRRGACANGGAPSRAARRAASGFPGVKERIDKAMNVSILRETDRSSAGSAFSRPSVRPRPSSACSARCGAS